MFDAADRQLADCAEAQHGVFTRADAAKAGLKRHQIEYRVTHAWISVHEGVYRLRGVPVTWKGALLAACWTAPQPAAVSHRSAAALYELPGGRSDLVEITCARWRRVRFDGLIVHERVRAEARDISDVDGIPVVCPELVVLELAGLRPVPTYVEAVVQAARRSRLISLASTRAVLERHARQGVRGVRVLRSVLDEWDPAQQPTESEMETRLLQALRGAGVDAVPQYEILDRNGVFVARVDAALPKERIAIEYDSMQEHSDEFQLARDARRRNRIVAAGWRQLSARHRDLASGGRDLLEAIADLRRIA
jgi:very-short-patch-repair endonuclease